MLVASSLHTSQWKPDFSSSGQRDPTWTRLHAGDEVLSHGLEAVEWEIDHELGGTYSPVQVHVCAACGMDHCAPGNWVQVTRMPDDGVLIGLPHFPADDDRDGMPDYLTRCGGVFIPADAWRSQREQIGVLPDSRSFAATRNRDLLDAWMLDRRPAPVGPNADALAAATWVREHLVASDTLEREAALAQLDALVSTLTANPDAPVTGRLVFDDGLAQSEALHWDDPAAIQWHGLARVRDQYRIGFEGGVRYEDG